MPLHCRNPITLRMPIAKTRHYELMSHGHVTCVAVSSMNIGNHAILVYVRVRVTVTCVLVTRIMALWRNCVKSHAIQITD